MGYVLIAEQDCAARHVIELTLRLAGHTVEAVEGIANVDAALSAGGHDVVIIDPDVAGAAGLDLIRTLSERGDKARVLVMSGRRQRDAAARALRAGADDFITKPFSRNELLARLQRLTAS